jgi:hypothetical protein
MRSDHQLYCTGLDLASMDKILASYDGEWGAATGDLRCRLPVYPILSQFEFP